jgi:cell division transport system permease protein
VKFRRVVSLAGAIVAILVSVAAVVVIHNTIRLTLHSRWREIYIMQLVGATRSLIAAPFLLEGIIHGLLGATVTCCILIPVHMYLRSVASRSAPFWALAPDYQLLHFGLAVIAAGAVLGLTGSAFSVRRYLHRKPRWHT